MSIECFSCKVHQTQPLFFNVGSKIYSACERCAKKRFQTLDGQPIKIPVDKWKSYNDVYRDYLFHEPCPQYSSVTKQGDHWKRQVELPARVADRQKSRQSFE